MLGFGLLPTSALGSNGGAVKSFYATGLVKSLSAAVLTVHGARDVRCRLTPHSPATAAVTVGDRVAVTCTGNVLIRIRDFGQTTPPTPAPATTAQPTAPATTAGGSGSITALSSTSITVTGDRSLTCAITTAVAGLNNFHAGDAVRIGCVDGALYYVVAATPPATTTTTTTPSTAAPPNSYGIGTITALTATTITVTGDRTLSCELASSSPALGDYHIGEVVKIACQNSVLTGIVANTTTATTTTTTTTTVAAPPVPAPTTQNASSGKGTITALSPTSITVTGDQSLTCAIGPSSPAPSDYGLTVGAHVGIGCVSGVLTHLSSV